MKSFTTAAALAGALAVSAGCSTDTSTSGWSSAGSSPSMVTARNAYVPPTPAGMPQLGTTDFEPVPVTPGSPTGTFVGKKVVQLRDDLATLQQTISQLNGRLQSIRAATVRDAQAYHGTIAAMSARLQIGTTPGNPELERQWSQAQAELNRLENDIAAMNTLANRVTNDAALASYLLQATQAAYSMSGAVEEDHHQLAILEDDVNRTVVLIDRLLTEINQDVVRQRNYIQAERLELQQLASAVKEGELFGGGAGYSYTSYARAAEPRPAPAREYAPAGQDRPLVIIRFDDPNVQYEQPLYEALSEALERRPSASFEVVAVAPDAGASARSRRYADRVANSMTEMGLPATRLHRSTESGGSSAGEVRIYVR